MSERANEPARVLVLARQPFQLDDLAPEGGGPFAIRLMRRPDDLEQALDSFQPNVVLVDTTFVDGASFTAIERVLVHASEIRVLALTPKPPPHDDVAQATRAGAAGFIDVGSEPADFVTAIDAVREGKNWFPADEIPQVLSAVADDLDTTTAERRSRLTGMVLALVPLTALIAALQAAFWRRYMGQIGVRPVDLAVDPASRVIDTIVAMLFVIGVFAPLLLVGSWLDLLRDSPLNRGVIAQLLRRRKTAHLLVSALWLAIAALLAIGPDMAIVVIFGPIVSIAILAKVLDVGDELPRVLQIEGVSIRATILGGLAFSFVFVGLLGYETMVVGPDLRTDGVHGFIAPRVLGISAQPVQAFNVDTEEEPSGVLYLGGNADLYVLVDPCNNDRVDYVSVGSRRLVVIDEVTCAPGGA